MRERYPGMLAGKGETLRSVLLLRLMVEEVEGLGPVLAAPPQAVLVVASGQKELRTVLRQHTALVVAAVVVLRQA